MERSFQIYKDKICIASIAPKIFDVNEKYKLKCKKHVQVILYGSDARGDYRENSDIDIMLLTRLTDQQIEQVENRIYDPAFDFQMEYFIDINVVIKNEEQFNYWLGVLPFYDNIFQSNVFNHEGIERVFFTDFSK